MRLLICALLVLSSIPARAGTSDSEAAYDQARTQYYALKRDAQRRKYRDQWLEVAKAFDAVANTYPKSERAPDALFTAGRLYQELSQISWVDADLQAAVHDYRKLIEGFPKNHLTDDAAYWLAKAQLDRLSAPGEARETILGVLSVNAKGDYAGQLRQMLATIPEDEKPHRASSTQVVLPSSALKHAFAELTTPGKKGKRSASSKKRLESVRKAEGHSVTLAEQLGLKIHTVVVDAGHGGHDSGAIGPSGTQEKDIALDIAKRLATRLSHMGLEVVLTRDDDTFVRLEDRAKIANRAKGDLFISIHCNSSTSKSLRGIATYTLNTSSDRYSIRLAARENSSSEKGLSDLRFILADLATKANTAESQRLASLVQHSLVGELSHHYRHIRDRGTKQALFYVLLGAKMPAILVETSFISNPMEEKRLRSGVYQSRVARAIADGVQRFLTGRARLAKIP